MNYNVEFDDGSIPTVIFYDVRYVNTNGSGMALIFHANGTMDIVDANNVPQMHVEYVTNGQLVTGYNGTLSDDGYIFTSQSGNTFIYTP